jgi:phage terminase large subunit-like protein
VTVDPRWIRTPDDHAALAEGCSFDESAGSFVADFFQTFLRHSKGRFAAKPFDLLPWQRDLIDRLYGWKRPDGTRRFRECYVEVPKKNGKSTLTAGLELYHLVADGEPGAEVYTGARDKPQAGVIFREVDSMVRSSPELLKRLDVIAGNKRVVYPAAGSFLQALSADVASQEGLNASFTAIDELHVQPGPSLYHTLRYAGAAREQPLLFEISTAGEDRESICYQVHETVRQVNDGTLSDTTLLGVIYAASPEDDLESPDVWRKANPSLGYTLKEDDFGRDLKAARRSEADWISFCRYRLNLWLAAASRFLPRDRWDQCGQPFDPSELIGQPCDAGLDLASTKDLAALASVFPGGEVLVKFWTPEATLLERSRRDRVDYQGWVRAGLMTATPGYTIDYDRIRADLVAFHEVHPIRRLLCDPWNATQLAGQLLEQDGLPLEFLRQGFASLSAPTKELERMVLDGRLRHGGNPVLNWQADNACVDTDPAGNVKLSKKTSRQRIDGMAALVNAIAARMAGGGSGGVCDESPLVIL